jgi:hypothetical protein
VLGGALAQPARPRPLPVFTAKLAGLAGAAGPALAVLVPLPHGAVRHTALTASLDSADVDRFLLDVGEPVPDLDLYLLWTVARSLSGEVDTLVDSAAGSRAGLERVADRLLAHLGVAVRCPLRGVESPEEAIGAVAGRTLPAQVIQHAARDSTKAATPAQIVLALRDPGQTQPPA